MHLPAMPELPATSPIYIYAQTVNQVLRLVSNSVSTICIAIIRLLADGLFLQNDEVPYLQLVATLIDSSPAFSWSVWPILIFRIRWARTSTLVYICEAIMISQSFISQCSFTVARRTYRSRTATP